MDIPQLDPAAWTADKPIHFGLPYAGQTLDWLMSDNQTSYDLLIQDPDHRAYFEQQGWTQAGAISYRINSEGFRGDDFSNQSCLLTLGCSFTMGLGLPEHGVWPYITADNLKLSVVNLAWPGISTDTCVRFARYWIAKLRPELVIMVSPPDDRFEIHIDPDHVLETGNIFPVEVLMPQTKNSAFKQDNFIKHYWLNSTNSQMNQWKNQMTLKHLCGHYQIPCLIYSCTAAFGRSRKEVGYARDYLHAGILGHKMLANKILEDWNEIKHA